MAQNINILNRGTMNKEELNNITLALGLLDGDNYDHILMPFLNNKKFNLNYLRNYLEGYKLIKGKYYDDFSNILIYAFNISMKTNSKKAKNTKIAIQKLHDTYEPFNQIYNNYIRSRIKKKNLHTMLYNIDTLCHDDVFIHGRILHRIENNLTSTEHYECISMYYIDDKRCEDFISRLNEKFSTYIIHNVISKVIFLKGIPRIIYMKKINDLYYKITNETSIYEQIYIDGKNEIVKTQTYHHHDNYDVMAKHNVPTSHEYYNNVMIETDNLNTVWDKDLLIKIFEDQQIYNETHHINGHLFYDL